MTKVEYFNGSNLIGAATTPPFDAVWNDVAQASYTLKAKVTSSANLATDSTPVTVTVLAAPTAAADAGQKGSTINEEKTFITGTVQAPPNSAVAVNGQLATRTDDGRFFVNDVPLTEGANTLTVKVTTQDNQTSKQSINVNRMGAANVSNFRVNVDTAEGFAPLAAKLSVDDLGLPGVTHDFERIEFDLNGDGVVDYVATSLESTLLDFAREHERDEAIALAYLSGQHTMAAIAEHFGVHYTTVSRLVKVYEESQRAGT